MQDDVDPALQLRMRFDKREKINDQDIINALRTSKLVQQLTSEFIKKPLYAIWRIIALSEIPYTNRLEYTQQVIDYINKHLATPSGFSLTGKEKDILPCYNAMLAEAFSKLGYAQSSSVQNAITWIKTYQAFERDIPNSWSGKGIQKYGGCLKSTPCFIGVAKSVKALIYYNKAIESEDHEIKKRILKGTGYLLKHRLYKRLSHDQPINHHILDFAFPASYQLNIIELLEICYLTKNKEHSKSKDALEYVDSKRTKEGGWKSNYSYKAKGYILFDPRGKKAQWLTYLFQKYLSEKS